MNPSENFISLNHKGFLNIIFNGLNTPKTLIYKLGSNYLDNEYNPIDKNEISRILYSYEGELILKPAKNSNSGNGISFFKNEPEKILNILTETKDDYVVQEVIRQSSFTHQFNPTSLNTFRVLSLYINGKFSICSVILKLGGTGNRVDNGAKGALWVNINEAGQMESFGMTLLGEKRESHNNLFFKSKVVPNIKRIRNFVREAHYKIPTIGFVGWDIALDEDDKPVLIEGNMWWPSVSYPQLLSGKPLFGDRTSEVIEFVKKIQLMR